MRCTKPSRLALLVALLSPWAAAGAESAESLARSYRTSGRSAAARAPLARFAAEHARDQPGAVAELALAAGDLEAGRFEEALAAFRHTVTRLPEVADFAHFGTAKALVALGRKPEAIREYEAAIAHAPVSSQQAWAVVAAGHLLIEAGSGEAALRLVTRHLKQLPPPQGIFLHGAALEAAGRRDAAALELYKVYYEHPLSEEAGRAEALLARLQPLPPVPPALTLSRARKLMEGRDTRRAATELQAALPTFSGADRDLALVRIGVAKFHARDLAGAVQYLKTVNPVPTGEADAERLHFLVQAARRINRYDDVDEAVRQLNLRHRGSRWRMEALSAAANRFLIANDADGYEPLYAGCAEYGPSDPEAALCHWKLAWSRYIRRAADAPQRLREHVEKFPGSEDSAAALYFLGRLAEREGAPAAAKAYYQTVDQNFPNFYYAMVSRERLKSPGLMNEAASAPLLASLAALKLGRPSVGADFVMDDATRLRLRRARLLNQAAADEWAESELRFAARNGAKAPLCIMELSRFAQARGENGRALRIVKSVPGFLTWRLEDAPKEFWRMAYPLHFRDALERYAEEVDVDPYVVAGLIRQESEFDPGAISRVNARGLTQVMPATGRDVSRRLGMRNFSIAMLHQPDSSLRIGITYLRQMLNSFDSKWFLTLAAYNAGPSRANLWVKWADFREAPEFIETIPFHETRGYVQTVLRNADLYRRIWEGVPRPPVTAASAAPAPSPAAAAAATVSKPPAPRKKAPAANAASGSGRATRPPARSRTLARRP